jgi:hypothetical protein
MTEMRSSANPSELIKAKRKNYVDIVNRFG